MGEKENVVIEPATEADLDELSQMLGDLFAQESDFRPDKEKQLRGLRLIFEQPSRGRVFVLRRNGAIVGMINLLFTISTADMFQIDSGSIRWAFRKPSRLYLESPSGA